jgi:hypothetical protein
VSTDSTTFITRTRSAEGVASGTVPLADGTTLDLRVTVRLTTPGEACVAVSSGVAFAYAPPLPDDLAVRLDDRLYDGLYAGLAEVEDPLPPERLRLTVATLDTTPPLAHVLDPVDWCLVGTIGERLARLAAEAVRAAWPALRDGTP